MTSDRHAARDNIVLLVCVLPVFVWSAIRPFDRFTWWLEIAPVIMGFIALFAAQSRFVFCRLALVLIGTHMVILLIGGHYTYAKVPAFDWLRDTFELSRNHYDRLGHLAQGFVPAILAREMLLRLDVLHKPRWAGFLAVCFTLAFSAFYELIEWLAAVMTGESADAFLGTQGDPWDTQTDMFLALVGSIAALLTLSRTHDRSIRARLAG